MEILFLYICYAQSRVKHKNMAHWSNKLNPPPLKEDLADELGKDSTKLKDFENAIIERVSSRMYAGEISNDQKTVVGCEIFIRLTRPRKNEGVDQRYTF